MSAKEQYDQGIKFKDQKNYQEALKYFQKAVEIDPNYKDAYFYIGFVSLPINLSQSAKDALLKAIALGRNDEFVHQNLANACMRLGDVEGAIRSYKKTIEINPSKFVALAILGRLLADAGKKDEGSELLDRILASEPNQFKANFYKGDILAKDNKHEEAITHYKRGLTNSTNAPELVYRIGQMYMKLGNKEEAAKWYGCAEKRSPANSLEFCARGQCFYLLGDKEKATADFKKAQELIEKGEVLAFAPTFIQHVKDTLKSLLGAAEANDRAEAAIKNLDTKNPVINHFLQNIKKLQDEKVGISDKLVTQLDKDKSAEGDKNISDLDRVKNELEAKLAELKAHLTKVESNVKVIDNKVNDMQHNMNQMKEELDNKLDNFEKKLQSEMNKLDLNVESQEKLKGYFKAFLGTFSSAFVTAQVVDSGQVSLDAGSSATTILSTLASFAPFVGSGLSSTVTSVGEFLKSKEMITSARKLKGLAPDSSALSQLIGNTAFDALMNKKKQTQVCKISDEDMEEASQNMFKKLLQIVENISDKIDAYLYTALYKTAAERLGNSDANKLITEWIKGNISFYAIQKGFMKKLLETEENASAAEASSPKDVEKRKNQSQNACCNIF